MVIVLMVIVLFALILGLLVALVKWFWYWSVCMGLLLYFLENGYEIPDMETLAEYVSKAVEKETKAKIRGRK